jgi:hypothetical protein
MSHAVAEAVEISDQNRQLAEQFVVDAGACQAEIDAHTEGVADRISAIQDVHAELKESMQALGNAVEGARAEITQAAEQVHSRWRDVQSTAGQLVEDLASAHTRLDEDLVALQEAAVLSAQEIEVIPPSMKAAMDELEHGVASALLSASSSAHQGVVGSLRAVFEATPALQQGIETFAADHDLQLQASSMVRQQELMELGTRLQAQQARLREAVERGVGTLNEVRSTAIKRAQDQFAGLNKDSNHQIAAFRQSIEKLVEELAQCYADFSKLVSDARDLSKKATGSVETVTEALQSFSEKVSVFG